MSESARGADVSFGPTPPPVDDAPVVRALSNGLRVAVVRLPHLRTVSVVMAFGVGSRHEGPRIGGLSHLLEHMLYRGSERHPSAYALNRAIEAMGGDLEAATAADVTTFSISLPPSSVPGAFEILSEVFSRPKLADLALEKRIIREEILEGLDEDGRDVDPDDLSRQLLWGDHPLGRKIVGTEENLDRFDEGQLREHLERHYGAANAVLAVAGPVDAEPVFRSAERSFSSLRPASAPPLGPTPRPRRGPATRHVEESGSQTSVRLSFPTFGERDPRTPALELLGRLLDDGMSARLHRALIDESGLAYDAWAGLELHFDCGVLDVSGTCAHDKAPALLEATLGVLSELRRPVVPDELEHARRRQLWALEASVDDPCDAAEHAALAVLFGLPCGTRALAEATTAVTPAAVAEVARQILTPAGLHVVSVGLLSARQRAKVDEIARRWHPHGV